jgi:hypothetical protein
LALITKQEIREIEMGLERGMDMGGFWSAYSEAYGSDKSMKRWGRRIPAADAAMDSVLEVWK